jgi:hypothetical protein
MHSLTSALGGELSASRPDRCNPRERARYQLDGRLSGPQRRSGHGVEEKKNPSLRRESNPDHPIVQPVVSRYPGSHLAEGLTPSHGVH